jgi:NitT/TauT family transport system permease protein
MTEENMQTRSRSEELWSRNRKKVKIDLRNATNTIVFLAAFLAVWEVIVLLEVFPAVSLPSPFIVAQSLLDLIEDGTLVNSITITMLRLFVGFFISILIGVVVGLTMMKFKYFGKTLNSFAVGLQSFPSIAWIPFAILLIGLNDSGILFVVIMSSVFSIMISTYSGMRNIPTIYFWQPIWA